MSAFLQFAATTAQRMITSREPLDLDGATPGPSHLQKKIEELEALVLRGLPITPWTLPALFDAAKHISTIGINDRKFLLESLLTIMARLPDDSVFAAKLQELVIDMLYKDLSHPPSGYLALPRTLTAPEHSPAHHPGASSTASAPRILYAYRSFDGSDYNPLYPNLGKAGTPYARTVPSTNVTPTKSLPDPELIFDTLLRRDGFAPHPDGVSSLFFAFANLVIHSIFYTDRNDITINNASSYLDLSILYGHSEEACNKVRRKDGTGKLYNDTFADPRLLGMPPSTCALLVLFNRNHNYVAQKIFDINEHNKYHKPADLSSDEARHVQDDEIFHRSRLVNCGLFTQIILGDYVGAILGLVRDGLDWRLDPLQSMRQVDHEVSPQGQGNVVSIEFNLLYRWHASISEQDAKWTEDEFTKMKINWTEPGEFGKSLGAAMRDIANKPPTEWVFKDLKRDTTGKFRDGDLARILQDATSWSAGAFRARGTPAVLRAVEILGIQQSRKWGTCSMNEFRKFMGLKPYGTFKEWNKSENIHTAAEALYGNIDNLELYVGLQAEDAKEPMAGAGLCPGYTISRAILADAVALTRGDRFFTVDFTPINLTSWGYQDCQYDKGDGSFGGMLTKLLFRTLPNHYPVGSAYAHFPFLVPDKFKDRLRRLKGIPFDNYTWTRPVPPQEVVPVSTYKDVSAVMIDKDTFRSSYDGKISNITDKVLLYKQIIQQHLFSDQEISLWKHCFLYRTSMLIKEKSMEHIGSPEHRYVDIVKDVINLVPVYWFADELAGLEMKTRANPEGYYRDQDLYDKFADVGNYVFMNSDPAHDWALRERAHALAKEVIGHIVCHLERLSRSILYPSVMLETVTSFWAGHKASDKFLSQLLLARRTHTIEQIAASLFAEVVPTTAAYSKAVALIVNFYLDAKRESQLADLKQLSSERLTPESEAQILKYVREALRLDPPVSEVFRTARADTKLSNGVRVHRDQQVVADVRAANLDEHVFGRDPSKPVYNRTPVEDYGILGVGQYGLLSSRFFESTITPVLGAIFRLKDLKRADGESGVFNQFIQESHHGIKERLYINSSGQITPWPASLVLQYVETR
jgi:hypothetical protein